MRFGAVKSDWTHHFFGNACTKSGPLRFSQFSGCDWLCLFVDLWVFLSLWKIARCSVILLLPLLVNRNGISMPQMTTDTLQLLLELPVLSPFMTYHRLCNCEGHEFILGFKWGSCRSISCLLYDVVCPVPSQGHCSFPSFTVVDRFKDSDYSSGGHEFILGSKWGLCCSISCLLYDVVCPSI